MEHMFLLKIGISILSVLLFFKESIMNFLKKYSVPVLIIIFEIFFLYNFILVSCPEDIIWNMSSKMNEIFIISLIFIISSMWSVRSSHYFYSRQDRINFYELYLNRSDILSFNHENVKSIFHDDKITYNPASVYLGSARSFRENAIFYNILLFYLFFTLIFLVIHFVIIFIRFSIIINYIFLFLAIPFLLLTFYYLYRKKRNDRFNQLILWTHDYMEKVFPFLLTKKDDPKYPSVQKEKEMELIWRILLLNKLFVLLKNKSFYDTVQYHRKKLIKKINYLIEILIFSEWKDPSNIYLYSIVHKILLLVNDENNYHREKNFNKSIKNAENRAKKQTKNFQDKSMKKYNSDTINNLEKEIDSLKKVIENLDIAIERKKEKRNYDDQLIDILDYLKSSKDNTFNHINLSF